MSFRAAYGLAGSQFFMGQKIGKAKAHAYRPLPVLVGDETLGIEFCVGVEIARLYAVFSGETCQETVFRTGAAVEFMFTQGFLPGFAENDDEAGNDADARGSRPRGDSAVADLLAKGLPCGT